MGLSVLPLKSYARYMQSRYSDRRTVHTHGTRASKPHTSGKRRLILVGLFIALLGLGTWQGIHKFHVHTAAATTKPTKTATITKATPLPVNTQKPVAAIVAPTADNTPCTSNQLDKAVIISISKRHLWACETTHSAYDSAVVTGMENIAADLTPTGTYHIYGKQTNLYLNGSDSTGSWHDYVSYWMPFLNNQYGTYGFHDATWRAPTDFGTIDPYSDKGSHGCVELPLATAKWLFDWAAIGTTVIIQS